MKEKTIFFHTEDNIKIEGRLYESPSLEGAIICHPHPLYGGSMDNLVVELLQKAFGESGYSTLKFNFRGVGLSEGSYEDGLGEVKDFLGAFNYFKSLGIQKIYGAGYSFGSWIILKALRKINLSGLVLVAPPLDFMDFSNLTIPSIPTLVILGSRDEFCSLERLKSWAIQSGSNVEISILEGENHFFLTNPQKVVSLAKNFLEKLLK